MPLQPLAAIAPSTGERGSCELDARHAAPMATADGFERLERLRAVAGHIPEVADHLRVIDRWIDDGTTRPLEAYLALPTTAWRRRRYRRDAWLVRAALELGVSGSWAGPLALKAALDDFLSRGAWLAWRDDDAPPPGASRLRTCLFFAMKLNDGEELSARSLSRIARHVFAKKWREPAGTVTRIHSAINGATE